ncbi:integrase, catalytic region, zinc finger, CCHC-type containing protein [Tanacetum coccineum]
MTGDHLRLMNFMKKFIGTVRFGNDHFGAIMCYGDYVIGDSVISSVYYVEGLRHNLFSVGQFCDSDLEVAFRKHFFEDMMKSSPICLLSKASKNKSWLWHQRLNHLNFDTINDLVRKDLVRVRILENYNQGPILEFSLDMHRAEKGCNNLLVALCSTIVPPTNKELGDVLPTMFDDYFNSTSHVKDLKLKEFDSIQEMFDKAFKRQKVEDDKEIAELKQCLKIIPDEEEVAIDAIPLAVKSPSIIDWKIYKEGRKSYYQIMKADEKSQKYMFFSQMLKSFDREDLEDLYKLVKAKYKSTRLVEDLDLLL